MYFDSQKQAVQAAIKTLPAERRSRPRIVRIRDTLQLGEIQVSEALLEEVRENPLAELLEEARPLPFDEEGNLF